MPVICRYCLLALACVLLPSCSLWQGRPGISNWPPSIPPLAYFQCSYQSNPVNQQYQSEQEYLNWIIDFYQGSLLYPTGWQDVEATILSIAPPPERRLQQSQLQELGARIAAEWARHNDVRLIDNRLLSLWGSMLQLAPDAAQLARTIEVIGGDIERILAQELDPADINARQYELQLEIELFEDF